MTGTRQLLLWARRLHDVHDTTSPGVEFNFKRLLTFPVKGGDLISGLL